MVVARQLAIESLSPSRHRGWVLENHGEVFTKRWVVDLILDLVGYTPDEDLANKVVVEPSCGHGAFLISIVDRLVESCRIHGRNPAQASKAIRAYDLLGDNVDRSRQAVADRLHELGVPAPVGARLVKAWVSEADFLLIDHKPRSVDFVVGNPPYIRLEGIPIDVTESYRRACQTMRGRSDIYVGFIETALRLLRSGARLGFICADRWMRNQYGSALRDMISTGFAVDTVISMHDVDAFENDVSAYPAVTILRNGSQGRVNVADADANFNETSARTFRSWIANRPSGDLVTTGFRASQLTTWFRGPGLWPAGSPVQLGLIADLERRFPPLEDPSTGTRVGIGVATGCDDVYVRDDEPVVEPDRLLPLVLSSDLTSGWVEWSGRFLVNPWNRDGLVDLKSYPRLAAYLEANADQVLSRHVARNNPRNWYRTIDRVDPDLQRKPKLLLPDLKAEAHPVLDEGNFYPHHNLYYVVSSEWDLEVLGGLLLSDITNLFVGTYCVKMRGGCYRFQAQYLRRIRVPHIEAVSARDARRLSEAFRSRDKRAATSAAATVYKVNEEQLRHALLQSNRASLRSGSMQDDRQRRHVHAVRRSPG